MWMEDCPRDARDAGENVTSAGSVFSSLERLSSNRPSVTRTIKMTIKSLLTEFLVPN